MARLATRARWPGSKIIWCWPAPPPAWMAIQVCSAQGRAGTPVRWMPLNGTSHAILPTFTRSSGIDRDRRAILDHRIDLPHLSIGDGDTPCGPVLARIAVLARSAMDEDIPTRTFSQFLGLGPVHMVGIRNADTEIKGAVRVSAVDDVGAFGRPAVTLHLLVPCGRKTQPHIVIFQHPLRAQKIHAPRLLVDDNMGDFRPVVGGKLVAACRQAQSQPQKDKNPENPHFTASFAFFGQYTSILAICVAHFFGICVLCKPFFDAL